MFTASRDRRIIGDLLEGHALNVLDPVRRARSAPTWRPAPSAGTSITVGGRGRAPVLSSQGPGGRPGWPRSSS
ncbi:hypothetical protein ACR6C2_01015, partial [Streptomyces sp. INA 01156]